MPDLAAPLSVSNLVLRSKQLEIDAVRHLASRAELVDVIGQLIQGLQRERCNALGARRGHDGHHSCRWGGGNGPTARPASNYTAANVMNRSSMA
mgnify:CR=1 FL=1